MGQSRSATIQAKAPEQRLERGKIARIEALLPSDRGSDACGRARGKRNASEDL